MIGVKLVIQSLEDVKTGKPVHERLTPENAIQSTDLTIAILEAGMVSGKTSLMFIIGNPDGTFSVAEMSAAQFEMTVSAVRGAVQRFEGK